MTKTVGSAGTPQRAGDGARPVQVVHSEESTQSVLFSPNAKVGSQANLSARTHCVRCRRPMVGTTSVRCRRRTPERRLNITSELPTEIREGFIV